MGMACQCGRNSSWLMLAVGTVLLGIGTMGFSQSEGKQTLRGMVVDHTGAVVTHLSVEIAARPTGNTVAPEKQPSIRAKTDDQGGFSASLEPGTYEVCVPLFAKSCRTVEIKLSARPEFLVLKISLGDQPYGPVSQKSAFEQIAGPAAKNCGHVLMQKDPSQATACAMRAFKHHKPFFVIYDEPSMDSVAESGMAWAAQGEPYFVSYDSIGFRFELQLPDYKMPEISDTKVTRCSPPVRVYINEAGELDCFMQRELWERRIEGGYAEHLLSAGETGYWELIPALKKRLLEPESPNEEDEKTAIKMALARLGDREQQQELLCRLYRGSPEESQTVALDQIRYVGGWYAIRIYRELMKPAAQARFAKAKLRLREGDVALSEPRWWAVYSLAKVAPDPLPPGVDYGFNLAQVPEYSQKWAAWIRQNQGVWKKLKPTGAGVDFSGRSCGAAKQ